MNRNPLIKKQLLTGAFLLLAAQLGHSEATKPAMPEGNVLFQEDFEAGDFASNGWRFFAVGGADGTGEIRPDAASEGRSGLMLTRSGQDVGDTAFDRDASPVEVPAEATALAVVFDARRAPDCAVPTRLIVAAVSRGDALFTSEFVLGDGFQTFAMPVTSRGDAINLRFGLLSVGMEGHIDNIRVLDVTAGNRLMNGDFKLWQNGDPLMWRAFSVTEGEVTVERVDLGKKGTAALVRRKELGEDGGLDTGNVMTPVRAGETPILKFESSKVDGDANPVLAAQIALISANEPHPTLAREIVMSGSEFSETILTTPAPVTEDGFIVISFRPWDSGSDRPGVGAFKVRNVRLEISKAH